MKRANPEQLFQKALAEFLTLALPPGTWFTAFPAGGGGRLRGAILNGMGLKPGVPDILIVHDGRAYWLELKAPRGRVSTEQNDTWDALRDARSPVALARSVEEAETRLRQWGIPLRARAA